VQPSTTDSRAYLGFGANSNGCWSAVAAPNTGGFLIQNNLGFGYVDITSNAQNWVLNSWYKVAVQFGPGSTVTCNLYASDGATLLNTVSCSGVTGLPGGIAMRSFGGFSLDTISSGSANGPNISIWPTNSGNFVNGAWSGNIAVLQLITNVALSANDGNGHLGLSNPFNVVALPPVITNQPAGQKVAIGCAAVFSVVAGGTPPLNYQWWEAGSALNGQTNTSLVLSDVQIPQFTNYFVTVSDAAGSVTSSIAMLVQDHPPVAGQAILQTVNGVAKVRISDLLTNCTDADGDALTFVGASPNSTDGGTVFWQGNWVYYQAPAGLTNSDAFTYTISDGYCGGLATGNVLVQVMPPNGLSYDNIIIVRPDSSVLLVFAGIPGSTCRIQACDTLSPPDWTDLSTNTADSLGAYQYIDHPPTNSASRYYRSVSP
jgi:hypothetical protein